MTNPTSLWEWMDDVLIPGLYDVTWYNGQPFEYQEGFISTKLTFLMGMPRLRQLRMKTSKIAIAMAEGRGGGGSTFRNCFFLEGLPLDPPSADLISDHSCHFLILLLRYAL